MKSAWRLLILVSSRVEYHGAGADEQEAVSFNSLSGSGGQAAATIPAELYVPADRPGPFAAVVLVHGSGGVSDFREHWYAREFSARGYAALVIDSFKPRSVTGTIEDQSRVTTTQMLQDAYGALAFLAADKRIDPARIGVMGFSKGGTVTLWSAMKAVGDRFAAAGGVKQRFAFHLPFYPGCNFQHRSLATTGSPILMMLGELDDYTSPPDLHGLRQAPAVGRRQGGVPGRSRRLPCLGDRNRAALPGAGGARPPLRIPDRGRQSYTWVKDRGRPAGDAGDHGTEGGRRALPERMRTADSSRRRQRGDEAQGAGGGSVCLPGAAWADAAVGRS